MEQIFRVGDEVYHWKYGVGEVVKIGNDKTCPIEVEFEESTEGSVLTFTMDGYMVFDTLPTLSHTPYNFIDGGFSQRKPLPNIKKGTPVFVKNKSNDEWLVRTFSHFDNNNRINTFADSRLIGGTSYWDEYSLENPINY